jgi:hypothetical protein
MLIFVSGHYPVLGTQMLYFSDPVLSPRAEIAPPIEFFALTEGEIGPQLALDRTANVISRPEHVEPVAPTAAKYDSAMEKGFIEELELSGAAGRNHPED